MWIVDVSHWQGAIDAPLLASQGVDTVICKVDVDFDFHAKAVLDAGMNLGAYWWVDPAVDWRKQLAEFKARTEKYIISVYVLDVEQWWEVWGTWYQARAKKIAWELVKRFSPGKISETSRVMYEEVKKWGPTMIYTSQGFVKSYAQDMAKWLPGVPMWLAWYPYWKEAVPTTWDGIKAYMAKYFPKTVPLLPPGVDAKDVVAWQFSGDRLMLPGTYKDRAKTAISPLDLSIVLWSDQKYAEFIKDEVPETPPVALSRDEKVDILWAEHHPPS